jgi:hypothetical protein
MAEARTTRIEGNVIFEGDTVTVNGALKLKSGPSGTALAPAWTSGAPVLSAGSMYITVTAGSTTYRIPVWANS